LNPQPINEKLARIYTADYFLGSESDAGREAASRLKESTARLYLSEIRRYQGLHRGQLFERGGVTADSSGISGVGRLLIG